MGFPSLGKASFENNQNLRNKRTSVQDHPYFGKGKRLGEPNPFAEDLKVWQEQKNARAARLRRLIFGLIFILMLLAALLATVG